ncbi:hypothetical protein TNCV_2203251 [Trichonephila clavipes]|uniref:Tc1-like transposase DDE domain-containing protein n=1 Tax=Trichonephila clavipes TaxID=2585209 RepID=A0A8X6SCJ3_TRICX|nr:hypothetical protein TNCV_2203251 [Trichonephila clavipes]
MGLREEGFSNCAIGARVKRCSSTVMRVGKREPSLTSRAHIPGTIFQQDKARSHVAKTFGDVYSQNMKILSWPAYSTNMSPIEHVWDLVGRRLNRDMRPATSKYELFLPMREIRNYVPQPVFPNLFDPVPRRTASLIASRGGYTKY